MTAAADIIKRLNRRGVTLTPAPGGNITARPGGALTDTERAEILANKPALVSLLHRLYPDALTLAGVTTTDADRLSGYFAQAVRHGYATDDAEHIASLLQTRDRTGLDMGLCIECDHLRGRRCAAARSLKAAPDWMPVRHELVRCPLRKPIKD